MGVHRTCGEPGEILKINPHTIHVLRLPFPLSPSQVYYHGQNAENKAWSCCKWSRANGWTIMSALEVLASLEVRHSTNSLLNPNPNPNP